MMHPQPGAREYGALAAEARDRLDAKDREMARLRGALMAIRDRALGDNAGEHPSQLIRELRSIAREALKD